MKTLPNIVAPVSASHFRRFLATNSGPLTERRCSGIAFHHHDFSQGVFSFATRYLDLPQQVHHLLRVMLLLAIPGSLGPSSYHCNWFNFRWALQPRVLLRFEEGGQVSVDLLCICGRHPMRKPGSSVSSSLLVGRFPATL